MTLRLQLALLLLLVTFIPIALMTSHIEQRTSEEYVKSKDAALTQARDNVVQLYDNYIQNTLEVLWADSHIPSFRRYIEGEPIYREANLNRVHEMLRNVIVKDSIFVNSVALLDLSGNNLIDTSATLYRDVEAEYEYFLKGKESRLGYFSYALIDDVQGRALYVSTPIKSLEGHVIGLLRLRIEPSRIQLMLSQALKKTAFHARVFDGDMNILANLMNPDLIGKHYSETPLELMDQPSWQTFPEGLRLRSVRSRLNQVPWIVEVSLNEAEYTSRLDENYYRWLIELAIVFLVTMLAAITLATLFVRPIRKVEKAANRIAEGRYQKNVPVIGSKEVRKMAKSLNKMTETILSSVAELEVKHKAKEKAEHQLLKLNSELERRVEERTQELLTANKEKVEAMEQLLHNEKMASLGALVAGVTHEVNTPLGNNVTVASTLDDNIRQFRKLTLEGGMKRSDLESFLENCGYASEILQKNCDRASELMGSFKQVAVDQTSMRRRNFSISQSVNEVITTLHSTLKKFSHSIDLDIPMELHVNNYPGSFDQVITNLINNSIIHGFRNKSQGCIKISAREETVDGRACVVVDYQDDGCGVPKDIAEKIYEPFFTTRAEDVGSGMGLYLIRSILEKDMQGSICLDQTHSPGARFLFTIPLELIN